mmetsp:Transcript_32137/g.52132  ORF Transcript_32137/g.52132 Transcript_32137/m.52132 type:complete len:237 (+) Transcript_32137:815-1525(+)
MVSSAVSVEKRRFPACMSLWIKLSRRNIFMFIENTVRARSLFVSSIFSATFIPISFVEETRSFAELTSPSETSDSPSSIEEKKLEIVLPFAQLSTSTDGERRSKDTSGNFSVPSLVSRRKLFANFLRLYASHSKLVWRCSTSEKSSLFIGIVNLSESMLIRLKSRSASQYVSSSTLGCCTFTATSRTLPSIAYSRFNVALWTWATVPLATGSSSKVSKISSISRPNDSLMMARVCS